MIISSFYEDNGIVGLSKYTLSYTTGAALIHETVLVASLYVELLDWSAVHIRVLEDNSFQARTLSTLKKVYGEVARRLSHLNIDQMKLLSSGTENQVKALIWLAICRQYLFIRDFTLEVLAAQHDSSRFLLTHNDYDAFFNAKAEWHSNLDTASKLTKGKARQVLFKMLRECGLTNDKDEILKQNLSEELVQAILKNSSDDLRIYPGLHS